MTNTGEQLILITDIAVEKFQELLFDADKRDSYLKIAIALEGTQMHYAIDIKMKWKKEIKSITLEN